MRDFFVAIYGETKGFVPVVTYPESERESGKPWKDWRLTHNEWFEYPKQLDEMVAYCKSKRKEDVYVTVGPCATKSRTKGSVKKLSVVHCDADAAKPADFAIEPTLTVTTSPGRTHLYWVLDRTYKAKEVEPVAHSVTYSQRGETGTGAAEGWARNKLLRVPGTRNTKPSYGGKCKVTYSNSHRVYRLTELKVEYPPVKELATKFEAMPTTLPEFNDVMARVPADHMDVWDLISQTAVEMPWNHEGSRYRVIWRLASKLLTIGLSKADVFVAITNSESDKYAQDGRSRTELWRDILKVEQALAEGDEGPQVTFVDEDEQHTQTTITVPFTAKPLLISDKERASIPRNIIDQFTDWAKVVADRSDPKYHQVNALSLLATVLGEFGRFPLKGKTSGLHFWSMVLGVTTVSAKTYAWEQAAKILRKLGSYRNQSYFLASDTTAQAMIEQLGFAGEGASVLFHKDEAHGLVAASKGGGYNAGINLTLTELFDGRLPEVARTSRESASKGGEIFMSMNLMGVPGAMMRALTKEDFATGFLARFVFVLGTPVELTREQMWQDQPDLSAKSPENRAENALFMRYVKLIKFWQRQASREKPAMIQFETNAWTRYQQFVWDIRRYAKRSPEPEMVEPTAVRMSELAARVACLLAMSEEKNKVQLPHLLTAISYVEEWLTTLVTLSDMVHQNDWARDVNAFVQVIANTRTGRLSHPEAARKFSNLKPREFIELVGSAQDSGRIRIVKEGSGRVYELIT